MEFKGCVENKSGWIEKYPDVLGITIDEKSMPLDDCSIIVMHKAGTVGYNCNDTNR
jgi:hypothetical protein